jgi:glycosyltransferase involved in cell wall biosynthesis
MKVAFIHNEKKIGTGAHYINDLMSLRLKDMGVEMKNFYPTASLDAPVHMSGLRNILFFYSLLEKRQKILKYDIIQGTTYTPIPFLAYPIPVVSHFGSTTKGFLETTPRASQMTGDTRNAWYDLKKSGAIRELNIKTRRPLRDIAEIEEYVAKRADAVIATSMKVKAELMEMGVEENKICLIHNAIEDYWFEESLPGFSPVPGIVFLGRLGNDAFNLKLKGLDRIVDVYKHFKNVPKSTVCMTTNKSLTSWLTDNIPNHSLHVNVKKEEIPSIVRPLRGSVLFISSRYEGFSLSLIEGMSQGLVPVAYDVGVVPEIIRNGENGFVVRSQKEAKEKISLLLADETLRKRCSLEAQKTAKAFRGNLIAKKLIILYEQILSQKKNS